MSVKRVILYLSIFLILESCVNNAINKQDKESERPYYNSTGFALIYEDSLYEEGVINKKLDNDKLLIMHSLLKKNTPVKITNLSNDKSIDAKILKRADYPEIFNLVITQEVAKILELDIENPYIELLEIKKNKKFIAKETKTFEEESNVVEKAPVDEIKVNELTLTKKETKKESYKENSFFIVISDFYYLDTANKLKNELTKKIGIDKFVVKKIKGNKYRLSIGSFKNFNALKSIYISLNNLGFEELNIYNENK